MRELERKQKEEEDNNGSLNTSSHQLIQNTSSTNSNHNSIHSGKTCSAPVCECVTGSIKGSGIVSPSVVWSEKYADGLNDRKWVWSHWLAMKLVFLRPCAIIGNSHTRPVSQGPDRQRKRRRFYRIISLVNYHSVISLRYNRIARIAQVFANAGHVDWRALYDVQVRECHTENLGSGPADSAREVDIETLGSSPLTSSISLSPWNSS